MPDLTAAIARLDVLADSAHRIAKTAANARWPRTALGAAQHLAAILEELAGGLDCAEDQPQAGDLLAQARVMLPAAFEMFGRAMAESLATGVKPRGRGPRQCEGGAKSLRISVRRPRWEPVCSAAKLQHGGFRSHAKGRRSVHAGTITTA